MERETRVGIVGYGFAGRGFHASLLRHEPRFRLTAVASRDPRRRAQAEEDYDVATFATLEDLLAHGLVELVVLATPHHVHAEQAVQVLEAGKHCVVDKVMALTSEEASRMLAARDRSGRILSVFHNRRWDGDFLTVRSVLQEGLLGEPRLLEIGIWRHARPRGWRAVKAEVGSILHDWGAHFVDQLLLLLPGEVVRITAAAQYDWPDLDVESYLGAELRFSGGEIARLELCNQSLRGKPHWFVQGTRGSLVKTGVDPQEAALLRGDILTAAEDPAHRAVVTASVAGTAAEMRLDTLRGDWTAYYRNLADALEGSAPLEVPPEQAARGVRILEAIERSIQEGTSLCGSW